MEIDTFVVKPPLDEDAVPVTVPISRATTIAHSNTAKFREAAQAFVDDRNRSDFYSRIGNPTASYVAQRIAYLEEAEEALLFSSGMGAISSTLLSLLRTGDHLICQAPIYGHTQSFVTDYITQFGVDVDFVAAPSAASVKKLMNDRTKLVYIETPSNPRVTLTDIADVSSVTSGSGIRLVVDSTFASPYLSKPLLLGADLVIHSGSKYLGGHSDVICGAAAGSAELMSVIHEWQMRLGTVIDPQGAWLLDRGIKTLPLRVQRHCDNALAVAKFLQENGDVIHEVNCPMLPGSPYHRLMNEQMPNGSGGVISFSVNGGMRCARAFLDAMQIVSIATSLGGVESLIEIPGDIQYKGKSADEVGAANATAGEEDTSPALVRFSVGIEAINDLLDDVGRGIAAARDSLS